MKVLAKIISRSQNFEFLAYLNVIDTILDFCGRGGGSPILIHPHLSQKQIGINHLNYLVFQP